MLKQGWAIGHGSTNHVHRKMHTLDVISSSFRSSKCNKIVGGWGFTSDPTGGAYSAPHIPLLGLRVTTSKAPTFKGGGEGAKMIHATRCQKASHRHS